MSRKAPLYVVDWQPPQLQRWEQDDAKALREHRARCLAHDEAAEALSALTAQRQKLWDVIQTARAHRWLSSEESARQNQDLEDQDQRLREATQAFHAQWPRILGTFGYACCLALRTETARLKAARADAETSTRQALIALRTADSRLTDAARTRLEAEDRAARALAAKDAAQAAEDQARIAWQQAAEAAGFGGQPSADLPPRPSRESFAMRYEPSLLPGINATEADVARREAFEHGLGIRSGPPARR